MPYAGRARFYSKTDNEKNSNIPVQPGTLNELMTAQLVKEKASAKKVLIEDEAITLETGAAGTTGIFSFNYDYILDGNGLYLGMYQDSSVDFTSTALLTEVEYKGEAPATFLASLSNGQYAIDYACGICFYKKADASTSATVNYLIRIIASDVVISNVEVENLDVSAFKNEAGAQKDAKVNGADILVIQTGSGNDATTMNEEIATENTLALLEGKDFATETTLDLVLTDTNTLAAIDYAVESGGNLDTIATNTSTLAAVDFATENTLASVLDALTLDEKEYDTIELTYVAPGNNGAGEVATVTYKDGVTTLYTLTLTYNSDNKLISVTRS